MDEMLEEFLTYCRKNINSKSRLKSVEHELEELRKEVYVMNRTTRFIRVFYLIRGSDLITLEFIKVISNTWRDVCEEVFFIFRAYGQLSRYNYCHVLSVLKKLNLAVCPGKINPAISTKIMESINKLIEIVGHDDALTRKIFRFHSVNHLDGYKDVLYFILKVRLVVDPREHNRLAAMVNNYREGRFGGKTSTECLQRIAIEVGTDNGYLGERFMKFVRENEWFDVTHEIPIVPEKTDFKWNSDLGRVYRMYDEVFSKGGTSKGQRMQHCATNGKQPIDVISRDISLLQISETDRDYRNYQIGNQDEASSNENVEQLNDLSASWDEKFRSESPVVSDNGENFKNLNMQSFGLTLNQLLDSTFNPQVNPYDLQVQSSFFNPQASSLNLQTTSFNPQACSFNSQTTSFNPQANSFNPQANSFNPQANSFNPQASSFNSHTTSFNSQPSSFNSQVNFFNPRANSLNTLASSFNPLAYSFDPHANSLNLQAYYKQKADSTKHMVQPVDKDDLSLSRDGDFWIPWLGTGGNHIDDSQAVCFDQGEIAKKEDRSAWLSNDCEQGKSKTDEVDPNEKIGYPPNPGCKTGKTTHPNNDSGSHDDTESGTKIDPYLKIPGRAERTKLKNKTVQSVGDKVKMWENDEVNDVVDEVKKKQLSGSVELKTCGGPKSALGDEIKSSAVDQSKIFCDLNDKGDHNFERVVQGDKEESDAPTKSFKKSERKRKFKE